VKHRLKIAYHKDLASHPVSHAWILNLYRSGEEHHLTVDDYFPAEYAPSTQLSKDLERHKNDEVKHGKIFAHLLNAAGWPLTDFAGDDVYNNVVRRFTPATFKMQDDDSQEERRVKLAHFLAHAHFLEMRVAESLVYHLEACDQLGKHDLVQGLGSIHKDEERHRTYTREAVFDLLTRKHAMQVFALHKEAEAKANISFSLTQVHYLLKNMTDYLSRYNIVLLKICAFIVERSKKYA
jgi:hypothetical protein